MLRIHFSHWSLRTLLALAAIPLVANACSSDASTQPDAAVGTFSMPLVTTANGHTYRLTGYISIYGSSYDEIYLGDETEVSRRLPTGDYAAYLYYYRLERLDEDTGRYEHVSANLVSSSYQPFTIYDRATTTVAFQFETDGVVITVGSGELVVNIGVTEVPPACAILGDDCPSGTWCAPAELTRQPISCVQAGPKAVGEACNDPVECAANSSCYEFGAGPLCTALCEPADFGSACAGGGTCTAAGATYGICVPEGGTLPSGSGGSGGSGGESGFGGEGPGGCGGRAAGGSCF